MEFAPTQTKPELRGLKSGPLKLRCFLEEIRRMEFAPTQTKPDLRGVEENPANGIRAYTDKTRSQRG